MEGIAQSKKLLMSKEGKMLKESIYNGTIHDINLNILTLILNQES
jgi:hypothetical protein